MDTKTVTARTPLLDMRRARSTPIRELSERERPLFLAHLLGLQAEDRYLRFGSPLSDTGIEVYVNGIDFRTDTLFGVFDDRLQLAAAGHFAAIARSVDGCRQHDRAIGRVRPVGRQRRTRQGPRHPRCSCAPASHARNLGISSLFMHCLSENRAMMRIARKAGMEIRQTHGEADAYLALEPGTVGTAFEEGVQRQIALFDFAVKRQLLFARRAFAAI